MSLQTSIGIINNVDDYGPDYRLSFRKVML